jgi:hypothetical protein
MPTPRGRPYRRRGEAHGVRAVGILTPVGTARPVQACAGVGVREEAAVNIQLRAERSPLRAVDTARGYMATFALVLAFAAACGPAAGGGAGPSPCPAGAAGAAGAPASASPTVSAEATTQTARGAGAPAAPAAPAATSARATTGTATVTQGAAGTMTLARGPYPTLSPPEQATVDAYRAMHAATQGLVGPTTPPGPNAQSRSGPPAGPQVVPHTASQGGSGGMAADCARR